MTHAESVRPTNSVGKETEFTHRILAAIERVVIVVRDRDLVLLVVIW